LHKVLIITYYWPPNGGSSVLRWLKFTKYLREFGWEPVIYTPSNPELLETDDSLQKDIPAGLEIVTSKIHEPYTIYKWLTGRKKRDRLGLALMSEKKKSGITGKIMLWIRSNFFIPDPRRLWVIPSGKFLTKYLIDHPVDVVVSTGPPHSMHLIGMALKRKLNIPWVADFRDPWTNIDFYRELLLTPIADRCHKKLEKQVLQNADRVITVSPGLTKEFMGKGISQVTTITNGYDEEPIQIEVPETKKFTMVHLGSMPGSRNPENLWNVLSELVRQETMFASMLQIRLIGKTDFAVKQSINKFGLQDYVSFEDYVPHDQTAGILATSSLLLLCINNSPNAGGILTNKFFEYLSANRPILAFGPDDGDASVILAETGAGKIFGYNITQGLKSHLLALFHLYSHHEQNAENLNIDKYSRKNLTRELSVVLNNLIT
jgi:glycosyltransferase involved in cell wall biosynthesis